MVVSKSTFLYIHIYVFCSIPIDRRKNIHRIDACIGADKIRFPKNVSEGQTNRRTFVIIEYHPY